MIIAVVSKKGGVGKTTTSVNLAAALAGRGHRTLLVDLDSQASASRSLGIQRAELAPSCADVLLSSLPIEEAIRPSTAPDLDLLTSSADMAMAEQDMTGFRRPEWVLSSRLDPVRDRYEFILLDCPPSLSLVPTNALVAADRFIIPTTPHFLALEGLRNLIRATERLCDAKQTRTTLLGILMTMVDYRTRLTRENVAAIRDEYHNAVFSLEVRVNVRLAEAPGFGQTIFQYDTESTGAGAYRLLAEEVLLRCGLGDEPPEVQDPAAASEATYALAEALSMFTN